MKNTKTMLAIAKRGLDYGKDWYLNAGRDLDSLTDIVIRESEFVLPVGSKMPIDLEYSSAIMSSFSPMTKVIRSIKFGMHFLVNGGLYRPPGSMKNSYTAALNAQKSLRCSGPKTEAFRRCIMIDQEAQYTGDEDRDLVIDTWILKAFGVADRRKPYGESNFNGMLNRCRSIQQELGINLAAVQASIWIGYQRISNIKDVPLIQENKIQEILDYALKPVEPNSMVKFVTVSKSNCLIVKG